MFTNERKNYLIIIIILLMRFFKLVINIFIHINIFKN